MPQKDQLCGAFWGALTLSAAGHATSQENVALEAGTTLAEGDPAHWLPPGASPRTDYEATIPGAPDEASAGTSATGVARSIEELSGGALAVVPVAGPWSAGTVVSLVEIAARASPECVLIANLRTGRLWGSRPPARLLLDYLLGRPVEAPPPDWDCGHFLTIAACVGGPGGTLILLRDTYPQLGRDGYHLQPAAAVAAALERGDGNEGGVLCACEAPAAGILEHLPALCAFTAPSVISYLRLGPHRWSAGFGYVGERDREATIRIPPIAKGDPAGQFNLEFRAADAAACPHLALAVLVLAGLRGIAEDLPEPHLMEQDPSQLDEEERIRRGVLPLPDSLEAALDALESDAVVRSWFSKDLLDCYLSVKRTEISLLEGVEPQEACERYFRVY